MSKSRHHSRENEGKSSKHHKKHKLKKKSKRDSFDGESSSSDEMDLSKEFHPISFYIDDREEMLRQVFKVIKGPKLRAMMTSQLRDLSFESLKELCLQQLMGMSKKRISHILAGKEMEESSDTDEDSDILDMELNDDFFESRNREDSEGRSASSSDLEVAAENGKKKKKPAEKEKSPAVKEETGDKNMELLELEMRARAIKSLLNVELGSGDKQDGGKNDVTKENAEAKVDEASKETNKKKEKEKETTETVNAQSTDTETEKKLKERKEDDKDEMRKAYEEEKRLQKAREALMASEKKKREEDEAMEKKHAEIKKRLEEQLKKKQAEEEEVRKKEQREAEKARKKAAKEAEYQKFLKWKEEKLKRENAEESQRAKANIKKKVQEMEEDDLKRKRERDELTKSTSMRKRKIDRQDVDEEMGSSVERSTEAQDKRRYRKKAVNEEGELTDDDDDVIEYSCRSSSRSLTRSRSRSCRTQSRSRSHSQIRHSRSGSSFSSSSGTPTLSESEEDEKVEKLRKDRMKRVKEIREMKRKRKEESDIEDGEVDSEGEHFVAVKSKKSCGESNQKARSLQLDEAPAETVAPDESSKHDDEEEVEDYTFKFSKSDPESDDDIDTTLDTEEDRQKSEQEERKRRDRMEKLRQQRLRRMKAFQARTEIQDELEEDDEDQQQSAESKDEPDDIVHSDDNVDNEPEARTSPREKEGDKNPLKELALKTAPDFYKSFYDEQERIATEKRESDVKQSIEANSVDCEDAVQQHQQEESSTSAIDESKSEETVPKEKICEKRVPENEVSNEIVPENKVREEKVAEEKVDEETLPEVDALDEQVSEKKVPEGIAYWKEVCESQGDFETPNKVEIVDKGSPPRDVVDDQKTAVPETGEEESVIATKGKKSTNFSMTKMNRKKLKTSKLRASAKAHQTPSTSGVQSRNHDLPTKQEVDAAQEVDMITWADRWFQNSKVQKVVKDSKMLSKVRTNIKVKLKPQEKPSAEQDKEPEKLEGDDSIPNIIGSMQEYARIVGKPVENLEEKCANDDSSSSSESEEDDGLWGAILGKKS